MPQQPLGNALAEVEEPHDCPEQEEQRVVPEVALEAAVHCEVKLTLPGFLTEPSAGRGDVPSRVRLWSQARPDTFVGGTFPSASLPVRQRSFRLEVYMYEV